MSAAYILWFAEEARRIYGDVIPRLAQLQDPRDQRAARGQVRSRHGTSSSMIARKLGAALAAGCTIVIKPASQTPYSALAWGVLCEHAGIPAGVVNILTGSARAIGAELREIHS